MEKSFECYADHGFYGTGMNALTKYCGCNIAIFYRHFENLDDLIIQSTAHCTSQQILDTNFKKLFSYIVRLHKPYDTLDIAPRNAGQLSPTV